MRCICSLIYKVQLSTVGSKGSPVFPRLVIVGYSPSPSRTVPSSSSDFYYQLLSSVSIFLDTILDITKSVYHYGGSWFFSRCPKYPFFKVSMMLFSRVSHFQGVLLQCCCVVYLSRTQRETQVESLWKQYKSLDARVAVVHC